ncbi:MAG TPA: hypothetical protein VF721_09500 [Pyrinomonadaceae bacterium]|jgi:hypothetical protein
MKARGFWKPFIISLAAMPFCLFFGMASAGAGHSDYFFAKVLFPFTMLSVLVFNSITIPFFLLAVAQFPLYGIILGFANLKNKLRVSTIGLLLVHLLALAVCFLLTGERFS